MPRATLQDTVQDVIVKLADGNPGATRVCVELLAKTEDIDPDSALRGAGKLLQLDDLGIYGPRIWMLYKDVCDEDLVKMVAMLRGIQLGYIKKEDLSHAIDNMGEGVDPDDILAQVRDRLPAFQND